MLAPSFFSLLRRFFRNAILLLLIFTMSLPSHAALKCEEILPSRACVDATPRSTTVNAITVSVPAPILSGYDQACWLWQRKFQCVEDTPTYSCDPVPPATTGSDYPTVKKECSLTGAKTNNGVTINNRFYITDADYNYACSFKEFSTTQKLTTNDCPLLDTGAIVDTKTIASAPPNSETTAAITTDLTISQKRIDNHVCYKEPVTVCETKCSTTAPNPDDPTGKTLIPSSGACTKPTTNCIISSDNRGKEQGPSGRTTKEYTNYTCRSGDVPHCVTNGNCQLNKTTDVGILPNGQSSSQKQQYLCSTETRSCPDENKVEVSNCVTSNAWGLDQWSGSPKTLNGFSEANAALAKIDGISQGMNPISPYIFSGDDKRCHFAVGGFLNTLILAAAIAIAVAATGGLAGPLATASFSVGSSSAVLGASVWYTGATITASQIATAALVASAAAEAVDSRVFGNDCCRDLVVEGSDKWYKIGRKCTEDEVKLAIAKRKNLSIYLGEYCSKEGGWLFKSCTERERTYCVFDDILALTVNEQGRSQLDILSNQDPEATKITPELGFTAFTAARPIPPAVYTGLADGKWMSAASNNGSSVWYWQYPSYCATQELQTQAYTAYQDEVKAGTDLDGVQPAKMTDAQKKDYFQRILNLPTFQECPDSRGYVPFLTCSLKNDTCDTGKMPQTPSGAFVEPTGVDPSSGTTAQQLLLVDQNWRVQLVNTLHNVGDYGVNNAMATNPNFAAVNTSIGEFVSATGSCKSTGDCLYKFAMTSKVGNSGLGAKKRSKNYVRFPLYSYATSKYLPATNAVAIDGTLNPSVYGADINKGLGSPETFGGQRFIFRPNAMSTASATAMHTRVLLEWAGSEKDIKRPDLDYTPLLLPTDLPVGTPGWWPYTGTDGKQFYIKGSCDINSQWCSYNVEHDLNITRHPWGSPESPRCWGFTPDQLSALDFSSMDLSRWIDSMDLGAFSGDKAADTSAAVTTQVKASAQSFYDAYKSGATVDTPNAGALALLTNTSVLPLLGDKAPAGESYLLRVYVPNNWPQYYVDTSKNNNPVSNVRIDWGGVAAETLGADKNIAPAWRGAFDFGGVTPGTYKVKVMLDTASSGPQELSTFVSITPDGGAMPAPKAIADVTSDGLSGKEQKKYAPSLMSDGNYASESGLQGLAPAATDMFKAQGSNIVSPTTPTAP